MSGALERLSVSQNKEETGRVRVDFGSIFVYNTISSYNVAVGERRPISEEIACR